MQPPENYVVVINFQPLLIMMRMATALIQYTIRAGNGCSRRA